MSMKVVELPYSRIFFKGRAARACMQLTRKLKLEETLMHCMVFYTFAHCWWVWYPGIEAWLQLIKFILRALNQKFAPVTISRYTVYQICKVPWNESNFSQTSHVHNYSATTKESRFFFLFLFFTFCGISSEVKVIWSIWVQVLKVKLLALPLDHHLLHHMTSSL